MTVVAKDPPSIVRFCVIGGSGPTSTTVQGLPQWLKLIVVPRGNV